MTSRETGIYEWLDFLTTDTDNTTFRLFFNSLEGYPGQPSHADLVQLINFVTAVRLHQMRESFSRAEAAIKSKIEQAKKEKQQGQWPNWGDRPDGFDGPGGAE